MRFERYESYRYSGIDGDENIPQYWNSVRIDWVSKVIRGNTGFKKDELLESGTYVALQYGKTYKVNEINSTFKFYVNHEFYKSSQVVNSGDIILISTSETIEDLGHTCFYNRNDLGLIGGEQILLKSNRQYVFDKYLFYSSKVFSGKLKKYATGLKVFRFNIDDLKNIFISMPQISEQTKLANYLDTKTKKIDKEISILEQKIKKYKELKETLITETVLRGLDKDVALKESGIEWVGSIPEHWDVKRVKDLYSISKRLVGENSHNFRLLSLTQNGVIYRDIDSGIGKFPAEFNTYQIVEQNDLIFCLFDMDVTPRTIGISKYYGMITGAYTIIKSSKNMFNMYYFYLFLMADMKKKLSRYYTGLRSTIKKEKFMALNLPVPSYEEQVQIVNYLDEKTSKIDSIVKSIEDKIKVLKEFRKTLINDVVTGKVKVA